MSIKPILPHLSDQEMLAICEVSIALGAEVEVGGLDPDNMPDPNYARWVISIQLEENEQESGLGDRYGIDVKALIRRIEDWTEAEIEGVREMLANVWRTCLDYDDQSLMLAAIRAKLTPTAHALMQNARRQKELKELKELHAAKHFEGTTDAP